jgi:membrane protein required for colicin V production
VNAVDITILAVLALLLFKGLWLGLIQELCGLAGLGVGTVVAARYHAALAESLPDWARMAPPVSIALCFAALFLAGVVCFTLLGVVLSRFFKMIFLGGLNRVLGGLFGLAQGVLLLALVMYGLSTTAWLTEARQKSRLAPPFAALGEQVMSGGRQLLR